MLLLRLLLLLGAGAADFVSLQPEPGSSSVPVPLSELSLRASAPLNASLGFITVQLPAGSERVACNSSAVVVSGRTAVVSLPREIDTFATALSVHVEPGCFAGEPQGADWAFATEPAPRTPTGNTTTVPSQIKVVGVGVYVVDVASVDMHASTFYADVELFLLEFYRSFDSEAEALATATEPSARGGPQSRVCKAHDGSEAAQWLYLSNQTEAAVPLEFINIGKLPKVAMHMRTHDSSMLDHIRVQSEFYFQPQLREYPFQTQTLPLSLELTGDSVEAKPAAVLCGLERLSGFPRALSSFAALTEANPLVADFVVSERGRTPPFAANGGAAHRVPLVYPTGESPSRVTSRLSFVMQYRRGAVFGLLELAPAGFIALSALISYALPVTEYRAALTTATTALLSAIVQHSTLRAGVPEQALLTAADVVMIVCYIVILGAFCGAAAIAILLRVPRYSMYAPAVHDVARLLGPASATLLVVFAFDDPASSAAWGTATGAAIAVFAGLLALRDVWRRQFRYVRHRGSARTWTADDVRHWLAHAAVVGVPRAALRHYADLFAFERVDGRALPMLTVDKLAGFGVPFGDAVRVQEAVEGLLCSSDRGAGADGGNDDGGDDADGDGEVEMVPLMG